MTAYARTRVANGKGTMVHRTGCHMAQRGKAELWEWADTVPKHMVLEMIMRLDYRACAYCCPELRK